MSFIDILLSVVMVIGPTIGYFDQYRIILQNKSSGGFNSITCAILCFSNILRLFFWFGKRFDSTLLFQSIAMLTVIILLLQVVVQYKPFDYRQSSSLQQHQQSLLTKMTRISSFWKWDYFIDYINCLLTFTSVIAVLYIMFHRLNFFIELLGFLSLGIESTLPLPQVLTHFKRRSTEGFSLLILASWFLGDGFKAFYFIHQESPIQFIICAFIQLSLDSIIVLQYILFSSPVKKYFGIASTTAMLIDEEEDFAEEEYYHPYQPIS